MPHSYERATYFDDVLDLGMNDLPAFADTTFITVASNYLMRMNFQLSQELYLNGGSVNIITTWDKVIENLLKQDNFGKYLKKSEKFSAKLMDMGGLEKEPEGSRFNAVMDFMKNHFRWNGDLSRTESQKPEKLISGKTGNSADINLLAVSMLRSAGIDAHPVLISIRSTDPFAVTIRICRSLTM